MRKVPLILSWIAANAVGEAFAFVLTVALTARLLAGLRPLGITPSAAGPIVTPAQLLVLGAVVGTAQWLALRGRVGWVRWWTPLTVIGALAASPLRVVVDDTFRALLHHKPTPVEALTWALLGGLAVGLGLACAQWPVLRRNFPHAAVWLLAGAVGGGAGATFETTLRIAGVTQSATQLTGFDPLSGLVSGAASAAVTGLALVWLMRSAGSSSRGAATQLSAQRTDPAGANPDGIGPLHPGALASP